MRTRVPTLVGEVDWQSSNVARAAPSSGDGGTLPGTKPIVVARDFKGGKYEFYESRMVIRWIGRRNEIDYSEILDVDSYSGSSGGREQHGCGLLVRGRKKYIHLGNPMTSDGLRLSTWLRQRGAGRLEELGRVLDVGSSGAPIVTTSDLTSEIVTLAVASVLVSGYIGILLVPRVGLIVLAIPAAIIGLLAMKTLRAAKLEFYPDRMLLLEHGKREPLNYSQILSLSKDPANPRGTIDIEFQGKKRHAFRNTGLAQGGDLRLLLRYKIHDKRVPKS